MSTRYLGGIIRKTPLALDPALGNAANGVFTMSQYMQAVKNATWPGFDQYFNQTVLSLHGNGTSGDQNNTFLDSSTNNFTITRNGNTTQGTFSPFSLSDGYWSNYFDGTDDYLSVADNAVLRPGAGAFTLEAWIYRNASGAAHTVYAKGGASTGIVFQITSGNVLRFTHTTTNIDSTGTVAANAWVHVAVVREGTGTNQTKLYINGVQDGQGTVSTDFTQTEEVRIGTNRGATEDFAGYISNVRFVKGSALYTAGFTPSTVPLTTTSQGASSSEVELLTCQSNRFVDNSSNAFAITRNGDVRVTPFSPFAPTAAYSAGTNGGSGYFDGTGDGLSIANNAAFDVGTGDFTVEAWIYTNTVAAGQAMIAHRQESAVGGAVFQFRRNAAQIQLLLRATGGSIQTVSTSSFLTVGAWYHVAAVRASGVVTIYVNGATDGTGSANANPNCSQPFSVGFYDDGVLQDLYWNGYLSNVRLVKGTAVTPPSGGPTSPVTAISGTSLLCNFTNAGIFDNTGKNVLETVGNAQIDTGTKKYGTGSLEFDGTGDRLVLLANPDLTFGTGDFTIEFWIYPNTVSVALQQIFTTDSRAFPDANAMFINFRSGADIAKIALTNNTTQFAISTNLTASVWQHIAVVRSNGVSTVYLNGTGGSAVSCTTNFTTNSPSIGFGLNAELNGYIDDLRITKGVARYTANFTAQTSQWQDQ